MNTSVRMELGPVAGDPVHWPPVRRRCRQAPRRAVDFCIEIDPQRVDFSLPHRFGFRFSNEHHEESRKYSVMLLCLHNCKQNAPVPLTSHQTRRTELTLAVAQQPSLSTPEAPLRKHRRAHEFFCSGICNQPIATGAFESVSRCIGKLPVRPSKVA